MVDEGIAVVLVVGVDEIVAGAFGVVGRVLLVPQEQGVEAAHLRAGRRVGHEVHVGRVRHRPVVAHVHVKQGPGDVAAFLGRGLKGIRVEAGLRGQRMRRDMVARVPRIAEVVVEAGPRGVDGVVGGHDVEEVAVVRTGLVGVAARTRPEVFPVPGRTGRDGRVRIRQEDVRRVGRIAPDDRQRGDQTSIRNDAVAGHDPVQRLLELPAGQTVGRVVVALGWVCPQ